MSACDRPGAYRPGVGPTGGKTRWRGVAGGLLLAAALAWPTALGAAWLGDRSVGVEAIVPEAEYESAFIACRVAIEHRGSGSIIPGSAVVTVDGRRAVVEASNSIERLTCEVRWTAGFNEVELTLAEVSVEA